MPLEPAPLELADVEAGRFMHGMAIPSDAGAAGLRRVLGAGGELLGVGELSEGALRPKVVLPPDAD